ncbi:MAG: SCO family protein [Crocinitomicaceae bacterium]
MKIDAKYIYSLFVIVAITFQSCSSDTSNGHQKTLPHLGFRDIELNEVNGTLTADTIYHTIGNFYFTSHLGTPINNETVEGKIYVVDFFFSHCPSICPIMTENLKRFHNSTKDIEELIILSHTIDPERDTLERLNEYIKLHQIETRDNWFFLRGSSEYTYDIGKDEYLINADIDREAEGGFLHSEHFVLIDRLGHIRGMYEGTDTAAVNQLEEDIRLLLSTEYASKK